MELGGSRLRYYQGNVGAHPNNLNTVRHWYKEMLAEIADSTILSSILSEIYGCNGDYLKKSGDLSKLIRQSNYALT